MAPLVHDASLRRFPLLKIISNETKIQYIKFSFNSNFVDDKIETKFKKNENLYFFFNIVNSLK